MWFDDLFPNLINFLTKNVFIYLLFLVLVTVTVCLELQLYVKFAFTDKDKRTKKYSFRVGHTSTHQRIHKTQHQLREKTHSPPRRNWPREKVRLMVFRSQYMGIDRLAL